VWGDQEAAKSREEQGGSDEKGLADVQLGYGKSPTSGGGKTYRGGASPGGLEGG